MSQIPKDVIDKIRLAVDLPRLIEETALLSPNFQGGHDSLRGRCPFPDHGGEGDFGVKREADGWIYNCFGGTCESNPWSTGDCFKWLMARYGIKFPEAVRMAGEMAGIDVSMFLAQDPESKQKLKAFKKRLAALHRIKERALSEAQQALPESPVLHVSEESFVGLMPPLEELREMLSSFPSQILDDIGLSNPALDQSPAWKNGGWVVIADLAMQPLGDPKAPVIGKNGAASAAWFGLEGELLPKAQSQGWVTIASDDLVLLAALRSGYKEVVYPVGDLSGDELASQLNRNIREPVVLCSPSYDSRARALEIGLALANQFPEALVAELSLRRLQEGASDVERSVLGAVDSAGTLFEWQSVLLERALASNPDLAWDEVSAPLQRIVDQLPRDRPHRWKWEAHRRELDRLRQKLFGLREEPPLSAAQKL